MQSYRKKKKADFAECVLQCPFLIRVALEPCQERMGGLQQEKKCCTRLYCALA